MPLNPFTSALIGTVVNNPVVKMGLNKSSFDPPRTNFQLRAFLLRKPVPPPSCYWTRKVFEWGMLGNDEKGDCGPAAGFHMEMAWQAENGTRYRPATSTVFEFYDKISPDDSGVDLEEMMKWWRTEGLLLNSPDPANKDKIKAYVQVDLTDRQEVQTAIWLFGGIIAGLALPNFAIKGDSLAEVLATPWKSPSWWKTFWPDNLPNPNNGHAVPFLAYDDGGLPGGVTWGALKGASWGFIRRYGIVAYAAVSSEDWAVNHRAPNGFDEDLLDSALVSMKH